MPLDPLTMTLLVQAGSAALGHFMQDDDDGLEKLSSFTPEQENFYNNYLKQAQGLGENGYNQAISQLLQYLNPNSSVYDTYDKNLRNQFQQKTLPGIAEQYAGVGALSSSGFGQALGAAAGDLETNLASLRQQGGLSAAQGLLNQYNTQASTALGAQPFQYLNREKGAGFASSALNSFASNLNPGSFSGFMNNAPNESTNAQFPLTNMYDQMFRVQGLPAT